MKPIFVCILLLSSAMLAEAATNRTPVSDGEIARDIRNLQDDIKEVRRDQLNYKIERDLLKEAYATNLKTVDVLITIAFGTITIVVSILGFLGLRNVAAIRKEYQDDLAVLRKMKLEFESDLDHIKKREGETSDQVSNLANRIQLLELQEKVAQLFKNNDFVRTLNYIEVGLSLAPEDETFLNIRYLCHLKLRNYAAALQSNETLLTKNAKGAVANQAELYLIMKRISDYDQLMAKTTSFGPPYELNEPELRIYLQALRSYMVGDEAKLKEDIQKYLELAAPGQSKRIGTWMFDDVEVAIRDQPELPIKKLLVNFLNALSGRTPIESLKVS